jgi:hypothetical protein
MVTSAMETASTLDQATLDALQESVASVLAEQCGSTELHAFIDGNNTLGKTLWAQAGQLGWLGFEIPEQYGVSAWAPKVSPSCMANCGGNRRRDPMSPICRRRKPSSKPVAKRFARHGCRGWHPGISVPQCQQHWTCAA